VVHDITFILPLAEMDQQSSPTTTPDSQMFHGRPVAAQVDMVLVRHWFETCSSGHRLAKSHSTPREGRWLREGGNSHGDEDCSPVPRRKISHFRLVDVKNRCVILAQGQEEYSALSYVWGCTKRLLLIAENLAELSTPGALSPDNEQVPRTFKDALFVSEQLSIAFLWIDAVCVLQDNEVQLVEHMNFMDSIYSAAILTIVSDAESADSGVPGVSIPRGPSQVTFTHDSKTYISAKRTFGRALGDSFWESRAWCL